MKKTLATAIDYIKKLEADFESLDVDTKSMKLFTELYNTAERLQKDNDNKDLLNEFEKLLSEADDKKMFLEESEQRLKRVTDKFAKLGIKTKESIAFKELNQKLKSIKSIDMNNDTIEEYYKKAKEINNILNSLEKVKVMERITSRIKKISEMYSLMGVNANNLEEFETIEAELKLFRMRILSGVSTELKEEEIIKGLEEKLDSLEATPIFYSAAVNNLINIDINSDENISDFSAYNHLVAIFKSLRDVNVGKISIRDFVNEMHKYNIKPNAIDNKYENPEFEDEEKTELIHEITHDIDKNNGRKL